MTKQVNALTQIGVFICLVGLIVPFSDRAAAHGWKAPADAANTTNPVEKDQKSIERGEAIYQKSCAHCHGKDGRGDGPLATNLKSKPANLVQRSKHHSDGDFFWKISVGRGPMPAFKDNLGERDMWDVINYIRSLK